MSELKLVPFCFENSSIVLSWRNSDRIRKNMLDNSMIDIKQHQNFLNSLESDSSRSYFVVMLKKTPVAAIYFTGLGSKEVTWGCYIGSERTIPGLFAALVVIATNYSFSWSNTDVLRSEVAAHNANPKKMNDFLGIPEVGRFTRLTSSGSYVDFIEYKLSNNLKENVITKAYTILPRSLRKSCDSILMEI